MNVLVAGTFDLPHLGHFTYLEKCARLGTVTVALSGDDNAARKRRPILTYAERYHTLALLPWVNHIVPKDLPSITSLIETQNAQCLTYGSDWTEQDWLDENQITRHYLDYHYISLIRMINNGSMSTTDIIERAALSVRPSSMP